MDAQIEASDFHPDVTWHEDIDDQIAKLSRRKKAQDFDDGDVLPKLYRESKSMPGTYVDRSFGQCACCICSDVMLSSHEREWMMATLAKHVAAMSPIDALLWIDEWARRHGNFARNVLQRHIDWINSTKREGLDG